MATLWVLGETSAPSANPSCSVLPLLLRHAGEGNTSLCNTLHSCWVPRQGAMCRQGYVLQRGKIHKNEWSFTGQIICVCVCVCEAAKKMFSSSLNFQSLCKTSGMKSLCISHLFTLPGHSHISRNLDLSLCLAPSSALVRPLSLFHSASNSGCIWS